MENNIIKVLIIPLIILLIPPKIHSWGSWFGWSSKNPSWKNNKMESNLVAEFSMEALNDPNAIELVENARTKLEGLNPCWFNAYKKLFSSCSEIFAEEEKRSRLASLLSDCFQMDSGRNSFPLCDEWSCMIDCLRKLNNDEHKIYLEFYLQTNTICHQLQLSFLLC